MKNHHSDLKDFHFVTLTRLSIYLSMLPLQSEKFICPLSLLGL